MKMDISKAAKTATKAVSDNSPAILTGFAVAGTFTTALFTAKASSRATLRLLELDYDGDFTPKEQVQATWRFYIPAVSMGVATTACILGAHSIHTRRNAAIMTAYSLTDKAFQEYKEKIVETIGEKKEGEARDAISKDRLDSTPLNKGDVVVLNSGRSLCYDEVTGRYFKSDMETIRRAVNNINQQCNNEAYASQNDFYREIGLDPIAIGEELGWRSDHHLDIRFTSHISGDGEPCLALDYRVGPIRGYYKGH